MTNIRIIVSYPHKRNSSIVVKANTKKYGENAIMFEGISFMECLNYIARVTGRDNFKVTALPYTPLYTDYKGQTLPYILSVKESESEQVDNSLVYMLLKAFDSQKKSK